MMPNLVLGIKPLGLVGFPTNPYVAAAAATVLYQHYYLYIYINIIIINKGHRSLTRLTRDR